MQCDIMDWTKAQVLGGQFVNGVHAKDASALPTSE
jgi:hypothetical protein